jgi:hypothetical protein
MTRLNVYPVVLLLLVIASASACRRSSTASTIPQTRNTSATVSDAPPECVAVFRAIFEYIRKPEPNLVTDKLAQERWLSKLFRKSLADGVKRAGDPKENPDYPSNQSFMGCWSYPTSYSIIGSRHYDYRNADNPDDNRAVIDVLYEWDKNGTLDNQYPGTKALKSFVFVFEDGAWKLDDIYAFTDEYASPGSLRGYFSRE